MYVVCLNCKKMKVKALLVLGRARLAASFFLFAKRTACMGLGLIFNEKKRQLNQSSHVTLAKRREGKVRIPKLSNN